MSRTTWSEPLEDLGARNHAADLRTSSQQAGHADGHTIWDGVVPEPMLPQQLDLEFAADRLQAVSPPPPPR